MSKILTIAYTAEGPTDERFLKAIIAKTFEEVAFDCDGIIDVYEPVYIRLHKKGGFVNGVIEVSRKAYNIGINVLCVHVDADSNNDEQIIQYKISPAFAAVDNENVVTNCKNLVAIIPIHMTEAWMLADKELLKEEMDTTMSNVDLGISRAPESIANPKNIIEEALNIAQQHLPKRRNRIAIKDLYQPIGQKVSIGKLETLGSFNKFRVAVENALRKLNYLR